MRNFNFAYYLFKPFRRTYLRLRCPWRTLILVLNTRREDSLLRKNSMKNRSSLQESDNDSANAIGSNQTVSKGSPIAVNWLLALSLHSGDRQTWNCDWRTHLVTCIHLSTWMLGYPRDLTRKRMSTSKKYRDSAKRHLWYTIIDNFLKSTKLNLNLFMQVLII